MRCCGHRRDRCLELGEVSTARQNAIRLGGREVLDLEPGACLIVPELSEVLWITASGSECTPCDPYRARNSVVVQPSAGSDTFLMFSHGRLGSGLTLY